MTFMGWTGEILTAKMQKTFRICNGLSSCYAMVSCPLSENRRIMGDNKARHKELIDAYHVAYLSMGREAGRGGGLFVDVSIHPNFAQDACVAVACVLHIPEIISSNSFDCLVSDRTVLLVTS